MWVIDGGANGLYCFFPPRQHVSSDDIVVAGRYAHPKHGQWLPGRCDAVVRHDGIPGAIEADARYTVGQVIAKEAEAGNEADVVLRDGCGWMDAR